MTRTPDERSARIRALNDRLRRTGEGGQVMITPGIEAMGEPLRGAVLRAVAAFEAFTPDNDPYGEHDCALLAVEGHRVMFKIDYYDTDLQYGSPDPADPNVTRLVMTIMLANEY